MKSIYKPRSQVELLMIKSVLVSEGIPFNVINDEFGSLEVGPQIGLFNERIIQVPEADADRAIELIQDFTTQTSSVAPVENYSFYGKVFSIAKKWVLKLIRPEKGTEGPNQAL
jgi:hypothetical protein